MVDDINLNIYDLNSFLSINDKQDTINEFEIDKFIESIKENNSFLNEIEDFKEMNNNDKDKLLEILNQLKYTRKTKMFFNFPNDGRNISEKFFSNPNIKNLIDLINILVEAFTSLKYIVDIKQIIIFSNFMLYYMNKSNELKGRIGQFYFENKNIL